MNHDSLQSDQITQPIIKSGGNSRNLSGKSRNLSEKHAKIMQPIKRIFLFRARNRRMNHHDSFLGLSESESESQMNR